MEFVVGSTAQQGLISKLLKLNCLPTIIPFPLERSKVKTMNEISKKSLGIPDSENVLSYIGRVSFGKNVFAL